MWFGWLVVGFVWCVFVVVVGGVGGCLVVWGCCWCLGGCGLLVGVGEGGVCVLGVCVVVGVVWCGVCGLLVFGGCGFLGVFGGVGCGLVLGVGLLVV